MNPVIGIWRDISKSDGFDVVFRHLLLFAFNLHIVKYTLRPIDKRDSKLMRYNAKTNIAEYPFVMEERNLLPL